MFKLFLTSVLLTTLSQAQAQTQAHAQVQLNQNPVRALRVNMFFIFKDNKWFCYFSTDTVHLPWFITKFGYSNPE